METVHYLRAIIRLWWLVLLTLVAGGAGGYAVYHQTTPLYRSSVQLIVTDASGDRTVANTRALALARIASTPPAVTDAMVAAGYPQATPQVTAVATGADPFIAISIVATNPVVARAIANAYGKSLPRTGARLDGDAASGIAVVSVAGLPGKPFSPNLPRDVGLGLAAGFILGCAVALLRDTLNRTVRDSAELERLTGLIALGTVPRDSKKVLMPITTDPRGPRAEAYRQIRTSVVNSSDKRPLVIVVTSALPGEGKTSVATNVAAAFSRAGHRVAIVDADLRRPRVADYFRLEIGLGLTDVLAGECALDDALVTLDDGRLVVLAAGRVPANPSEALSGFVMEKVLAQLAAQCDYVFLDTPPVLPVTDALVLAPKVDAVMLVCRLGDTTRETVKQAMASIARVNADILGVVPNRAGKGLDGDYGYKYRYAYAPTRRGGVEVEIAPEALQALQALPSPSSTAPAASQNGYSPSPPPPVPAVPTAAQNGRLRLGAHRVVSQTLSSAAERE